MGRAKARIPRLVLAVPIAIFVLALLGGDILLWRLFTFSILLLLLGYLWVRPELHGIEGKVELSSQYCQVGDLIRVSALIHNTTAWPKLILRVWQDNNLPGYTNQLAINLAPHESHSWQTEVYCCLRGKYHLGSLTVEASDPFGLIQVRRNLGDEMDLLVYPTTAELHFSPDFIFGEFGAERNSWLSRTPAGVVSRVREYIPGDSLNHIHWRTAAHAGRLMAKDFNLEVPKKTWIVLDMGMVSPPMRDIEPAVEERIIMVASLAKKYLESRLPLGVISEGDTFLSIPPSNGEKHFWRVMEALAVLRAEGRTTVDRLIQREKRNFGADSLVLVVTSSVTKELSTCIDQLNNRGIKAAIINLENTGFARPANRYVISRRVESRGIPIYVARRVLNEKAASSQSILMESLLTA